MRSVCRVATFFGLLLNIGAAQVTSPTASELAAMERFSKRPTAHVAWSTFQQTKLGTTVYRAGVAFTDAAQETLDDYCRRYGAENPLPSF